MRRLALLGAACALACAPLVAWAQPPAAQFPAGFAPGEAVEGWDFTTNARCVVGGAATCSASPAIEALNPACPNAGGTGVAAPGVVGKTYGGTVCPAPGQASSATVAASLTNSDASGTITATSTAQPVFAVPAAGTPRKGCTIENTSGLVTGGTPVTEVVRIVPAVGNPTNWPIISGQFFYCANGLGVDQDAIFISGPAGAAFSAGSQ